MTYLPQDDTIFALATARGVSALAIVRLSGPAAASIAQELCRRSLPDRTATYTPLYDDTGCIIDRAIALYFPKTSSPTGEDAVEFHVHGGYAVVDALLASLAKFSGARMAGGGEFTRRAVLHGKLDLTQAEAIADLIAAETPIQRHQALNQLSGALAHQIAEWTDQLLDALALIEAELDFSDEGDVDDGLLQSALTIVNAVQTSISVSLADHGRGERVRDGFRVAIAGPVNAGKSTLLNHLAGRDIAIVSPYAGTTRDVLEVSLNIGGYAVTLVDTAGIREAVDPVEQIGVERAKRVISEADLVLDLRPADSEEHLQLGKHMLSAPLIQVITKCDIEGCEQRLRTLIGPVADNDSRETVRISVHTGVGISDLLQRISNALELGAAEPMLITRHRHRAALEAARARLAACGTMADGDHAGVPELAAQDLRDAIRALAEVTGHALVEGVLDRVFSSFCIGK